MGWANRPLKFGKPKMGKYGFTFPAIVLEEHDDDTFTGIIDEGRLTTAKRIILDTVVS